MKKTLLLMVLLSISMMIQAQEFILHRVVKGESSPLPGVSVFVQGTKAGTSTDMDGNYSIKVKNGAKVTFSYIGYISQTIAIKSGQTKLDVDLKENSVVLNETVVVGYATQKKATLTGAVSSMSAEKLTKRSVASLSTALQGEMPGVTIQQTSGQPGADGGSIRIRGLGSINSDNSPLILVDGIEMDINQVDAASVESVSVLKDAASASIYGSRASNGVILITTKRGSEGKIQTSYSGYVTIQSPTNMPKPVAAWQYLQAELNSWDNAGITVSDAQRTQQLAMIEAQKTLMPDNWNRYDTDWKKETISENALMHNHNVTISGGGQNLKFFASGSYLGQDGLIANNNYNRTNLRINADAQIVKWAKFSLETALRQSNSLNPGLGTAKSIINQALYMLPTLSAARELDGNWGYGKNGLNPTAMAEASGTSRSKVSEALASGTLLLQPLPGLDILGQYSYHKTSARGRRVITPYTTSLKGQVMGVYPSQDGVDESWSETIRNYYRAQASYGKTISDHYFKVLVGFQAEDNNYSDFGAGRINFDLDKWYLSNGDPATATNYGGASSWAMASLFGRINYTYKDKYLVEVNGRYDGSSRFTSNNRWGMFPSASVGWVISSESFMENTKDYLDFLKLRLSYGLLGNQSLGSNYPYAAVINTGYGYYFGDGKELASGVTQTQLSNSNISWEKSKQFDLGVDANFFGNKLNVTADFYYKKVYDMLMAFPLPYYAGMSAPYTNAGDMKNIGWEVNLTHRNKIGDFNYGVTFTLSDNRNTVTNLNGLNSQDKTLVEGYPMNGLWGYLTDGYYKDWDDVANSPRYSNAARPGFIKYKKVNQDPNTNPNVIDTNDMVYLGDPFPHFEYGLTLTGGWKGFDATIFIQGVGQRKAYMSGVGLKPFANGANLFEHQLDSWTPENQDAEYPILVPEANAGDNYVKSDKWIRNAAYSRLKNVVLGYTLPKNLLSKASIESLRFYVSAQNLLTLSGFYKGYDPEVSYSGSVGGEFYPIMRTVTFGVDLKF